MCFVSRRKRLQYTKNKYFLVDMLALFFGIDHKQNFCQVLFKKLKNEAKKKIKANAHTNSPSERATKNGIKCHIHSVWKNKYYYIAVVLCGKLAARFFFSLPDFSVHHKRKIFHVWFIFILLALNCFELFCVVLPLHGFFHAADDFFSCARL